MTRSIKGMREALEDVARLPQREDFAANDSTVIHYRTYGEGEPILLLHGFPDMALGWAHQILDLARDHQVITPTLRGYPPSSTPDDLAAYHISVLAGDVGAVLDALGLNSAVMVGSDWGGVVLQAFSLFHPARVRGLALLNSPVLRPFLDLMASDPQQQAMAAYTLPYQAYATGNDKNVAEIVRNVRDFHWRDALSDYLTSSPIHGMMAYYKSTYPIPPYMQQTADPATFVYQVPSLILWGLEDEYFHNRHLAELWKWFALSYRFVSIPRAGHWVHQDAPEKVNSELRSWLATPALRSMPA